MIPRDPLIPRSILRAFCIPLNLAILSPFVGRHVVDACDGPTIVFVIFCLPEVLAGDDSAA